MPCFIPINDEKIHENRELKEEICIKCGGNDNSGGRNKSQKGSENWYIVDKINAKVACFLLVSKNLIINPKLAQNTPRFQVNILFFNQSFKMQVSLSVYLF